MALAIVSMPQRWPDHPAPKSLHPWPRIRLPQSEISLSHWVSLSLSLSGYSVRDRRKGERRGCWCVREEEEKRGEGFRWEEKPRGGVAPGVRENERKKKERKGRGKKKKDEGHVAPCEWVGGDNEILPSQLDCDMW
jgi:hypothetical protein